MSTTDDPKWTVVYNIPGDFVGTGWEFFKAKEAASRRYLELGALGWLGAMRPFQESDRQRMGAVHQRG